MKKVEFLVINEREFPSGMISDSYIMSDASSNYYDYIISEKQINRLKLLGSIYNGDIRLIQWIMNNFPEAKDKTVLIESSYI